MKKFFRKFKAFLKEMRERPDDWEQMDYYERKLYTASVFAAFGFIMTPILVIIIVLLLCQGCAGPSKIQRVQTEAMRAEIGLVQQPMPASQVLDIARPDTLVVHDDDGREMILMRAIKDENGDMVATDVINAAVVEARFRNVAERNGKVDIEFQIRVPREMQDETWQLRFYPEMRLPVGAGNDECDTLKLDQVVITGAKYRKAQLKGYQQYEKYLASIVTDSTRFINMRMLELFIQRNIPDLYAFKADSTEVADERIKVDNLKQDTEFRAVITVNELTGTTTSESMALVFTAPSGWEIWNDRLFGGAGDGIDYRDIRDNEVRWYFTLRSGSTRQFKIRLQASYEGTFHLPEIVCEDMYNAPYKSNTGSCSVCVSR